LGAEGRQSQDRHADWPQQPNRLRAFVTQVAFLTGLSVSTSRNPRKWGDEDDARIVRQRRVAGNEEGSRKAMETPSCQRPGMINVVYTIQ